MRIHVKNELLISAENIMDCLSDGVYVCDRDRRIVYWSKSAERITGWQSEDVLGRACLEDILNHEDKDGHRLCGEEYCPLHRAMVTGATTRVPVIVFALCKNGKRFPTQVATAPIRNEAGEVIGGSTAADAAAEGWGLACSSYCTVRCARRVGTIASSDVWR